MAEPTISRAEKASHTAHAEQVRALFDGKAIGWSAKYAPGGRLVGRLTRLADAVAYHVPPGGRVLDLGCGTGELARHLAASGLLVTGCDIAPQMLGRAVAADLASSVGWVLLDPKWRALPLQASSVDAVVASSVLEYVQWPGRILDECARVLRPGGFALCTVPNLAHPIRWLEWLAALAVRASQLPAASNDSPLFKDYLSYLRISQQRRSAQWWSALAAAAGLRTVEQFANAADRSPLRLLIFQRPGSESPDNAKELL
jgi:ubiquinone/menaquinone biosynthesis C-methylase UbiE